MSLDSCHYVDVSLTVLSSLLKSYVELSGMASGVNLVSPRFMLISCYLKATKGGLWSLSPRSL